LFSIAAFKTLDILQGNVRNYTLEVWWDL